MPNIKYGFLIIFILFTVNSIAVDRVSVIGLFKDKAVINIDGKQRVLKKGKTSPEGVLLISANSEFAVLEINGERKKMKLGTKISNKFKKPSEGATLIVPQNSRGMYFVNGSINGFQVEMLIDTGATFVSMNRNVAKRVGINYKLNGKKSFSQTASGISETYIVKIKKVKVGDLELRDVVGSVHDSDFPAIILLGNSFLNKFDRKVEGRVLKLQKKY